MRESGIYIITNKVNDKCYVGSSKNTKSRWLSHLQALRKGTHCNRYLQRVFNKYGENSLRFEVIFNCPEELLHEYEELFISQLCPDYNLGPVGGGDTWQKISQEEVLRRKSAISKGLRKYYDEVYTEEDSKERSARMKGEGNPNYGNKWSEQQRKNASERMRMRFENESGLRELLRDATNRYWENITEEEYAKFCNRRSEVTKGVKNPFYGKTHTEETKQRILKSRAETLSKKSKEELDKLHGRIPVIVEGNYYGSLVESSEVTGLSESTIYTRIISSNYEDYFSMRPDFEYKPVQKYKVILENSIVGENFIFNNYSEAVDFFSVHKETIARYIRQGFPPGHEYEGWGIHLEKSTYKKVNPYLEEL